MWGTRPRAGPLRKRGPAYPQFICEGPRFPTPSGCLAFNRRRSDNRCPAAASVSLAEIIAVQPKPSETDPWTSIRSGTFSIWPKH